MHDVRKFEVDIGGVIFKYGYTKLESEFLTSEPK